MSTALADLLAVNLLSDEEHKSLDNHTIGLMQHLGAWSEPALLAALVLDILQSATQRANLRTLTIEEISKLLSDKQVYRIVQDAAQLRSFENVRNLTTMLSWEAPYVGKAHEALYATISKVCSDPAGDIYARFLAVVQSSGTGKSRMIDELAKECFVIPINLRTTGTGFPPGDYNVSSFLVHAPFTPEDAFHRAQAFLISLFETTTRIIPFLDSKLHKIISSMEPKDRPTSVAQKFRLFMTTGQSYSRTGMLRMNFYSEVIRRANEILKLPLKASDTAMDITEGENVSLMDDDESMSSVDTVEGGKVHSSPVITFIENGAVLSLGETALQLIKILAPDMPFTTEIMQSKPPVLILAYDEAHSLSITKDDNPRAATAFSEHRRVLRGLRTYPVFSLFLSTTGKIHDLTPQPKNDASDRLRNLTPHLLPPFSTLGFDQMINTHNLMAGSQNVGINEVSKVGFMVLFGRPLWGTRYKHGSEIDKGDIVQFARQKLMHGEDPENPSSSAKLALMSVCLALEFNAQTTDAHVRQMEQVEKHMRICILVHKGFETAVTISPSEPLLAEAARQYMSTYRSRFNMPASLLEHLTIMGLDKGERGELVAQVLLILAADKACEEHLAIAGQQPIPTITSENQPMLELPLVSTVPRAFSVELFIKALLGEQWHDDVLNSLPAKWRTKTEAKQSFQTTFKDAKVYFTQFIKLDDVKVVNREFLWRLAIRGIVAVCANGQGGMDIIAPLVFGTGRLCRSQTSALLIQVKNDQCFKAQPNVILFDLMNPYLVRVFDMKEEHPLPIIRMVFAFASPTAAVEVLPQDVDRLPRKAKTATRKTVEKSPRYTAYDIWCAKASSETFRVIKMEDEQNYALLLKADKVFPQGYRSEFGVDEVESIRRSMNPGTSVNKAHWAFCGTNTPQLPHVDFADNVDFGEEVQEE